MPRFFGTITALDIDIPNYQSDFNDAIFEVFKIAAEKFIEAAIKRVAVMTGMSMGSFIGLAEEVGFPLTIVSPYSQKELDKQKWYYGRGGRIPKTPENGNELTRFVLEMRDGKAYFEFDAKTIQYSLQEIGEGRPSTYIPPPWHSLIDGRNAFMRYLQDNIKDAIPEINDYLIKTTYSFGRGENVTGTKYRTTKQKIVR